VRTNGPAACAALLRRAPAAGEMCSTAVPCHGGGVTRSLRPVGSVAPEARARVAHAACAVSLEDVLRAGFEIVEVVVQDEFTHDVITRANETFVVFDTT